MIFSMLRMVELCEQPFSRDSLNLRKNIATLFYLTGEKELANQFITEFVDYMMQSKNLAKLKILWQLHGLNGKHYMKLRRMCG